MVAAILWIVTTYSAAAPYAKWVTDLSSPYERVRLNALTELGKCGPKAALALRAICNQTQTKSPKVSRAALETVEAIDPELYTPLREFVLATNNQERIDAAAALAKIKSRAKPASPLIVAAIKKEGVVSARYSRPLLASLREFGAPETSTIEAMLSIANQKNADLRLRMDVVSVVCEWHLREEAPAKHAVVAIAYGLATGDVEFTVHCLEQAGRIGASAEPLLPAIKRFKLESVKEVREAADIAVQKIESQYP